MMKKGIIIASAFLVLSLGSCRKNNSEIQNTNVQTEVQDTPESQKITKDMAYEGVNNYCHKEYDWSIAEENPSIMYVSMGEETETEFQVIFRSYTGALVYFYVNKSNGTTRMVENVPSLDVEEEVGTIDLFDYIEKKK